MFKKSDFMEIEIEITKIRSNLKQEEQKKPLSISNLS